MYSHGTSALKTEYNIHDDRTNIRRDKQTKTVSQKALRKSTRLIKKRIVAAVMLAFSMAFLVLFRYATIAREFSELTQAREKLDLINASVIATQIEADGNIDPKVIEREALRLGMRQPTKDQVKYISLGNVDNGEVLKTEKTSALSAFVNSVSGILEYLY